MEYLLQLPSNHFSYNFLHLFSCLLSIWHKPFHPRVEDVDIVIFSFLCTRVQVFVLHLCFGRWCWLVFYKPDTYGFVWELVVNSVEFFFIRHPHHHPCEGQIILVFCCKGYLQNENMCNIFFMLAFFYLYSLINNLVDLSVYLLACQQHLFPSWWKDKTGNTYNTF